MREGLPVTRFISFPGRGCAVALLFALACGNDETGSGASAGGSNAGTASAGAPSAGAGGGTSSQGGQSGTGGSSGLGSGGTMTGSGGAEPTAGSPSNGGSTTGGTAGNGGGGNGGSAGAGGSSGAGPEELVQYYGRWNRLSDRAITVNSGSQLSAEFTGTAIRARFDVSLNVAGSIPTIAWQVDQGTWQEGEVAASVSLATGLTPGMHSLTVLARGLDELQSRWSPPLRSSITFLNFEVTDGALRASSRPVRPKIEILGDSITEGVKIWSSHNGQTGSSWTTDARIAYPFQTAQLLGAELRQVGFGYLGILKSGNGGVPRANDSFNWIYRDVPRDSWQADMVVVNEGTNDGSQNAVTFRDGYVTYLTTIRAAYANAKIVALRPFNGAQAAQVQASVQARNAAGDAKVYYVDTTGWLSSADYTDGLHPNSQGSLKAAQALSAAIQALGLP